MDLSLESYRTIVKNVRSRADLAVLCRVSKAFQHVAERALYNTLFLRISNAQNHNGQAVALCETLETQSRVAVLVEALTVMVADNGESSGGEDVMEEELEDIEEEEEGESFERDEEEELAVALEMSLTQTTQTEEQGEISTSAASSSRRTHEQSIGSRTNRRIHIDDVWKHVSRALQQTLRLRHLNIHISNNVEASMAWILDGCTFRLRSLHCDLSWDHHLVTFLNTQDDLEDLYIIDYEDSTTPRVSNSQSRLDIVSTTTHMDVAESSRDAHQGPPGPSSQPLMTLSISPNALRSLSVLECTFTEAAIALVPGRPIVRLKTAFSSPTLAEKRIEMNALFSRIRRTTRRIKSLDIGDSVYGEEFAMDMLQTIVNTSRTRDDLRYLGTLVLPVGGNERLMFYALLRRMHRLTTVELDVTSWEPPPIDAGPSAFRALANELRIYCRGIKKVIFVYEFERTIVKVIDGVMRVEIGRETTPTDSLWREV
ncbi:hypothetical protein K435DRAFT_768189 [Dendrothele bispora CBS 962.96]|uniref:Uncharacterized protein n=1 Tax=Dendrothele bispora (strain CBS 962.96) TaxID=1314807 RepID=A0A4S8KWE7_DENBC|nr:hypothetical protein K435DRAFT_768189 [Dendrothele bispora CBS 962.96]